MFQSLKNCKLDMLPKSSETQNLHWKNEATCWNWFLRSFQNNAIKVLFTCDYQKDSQWTAAGKQPSKLPPHVHPSTSIVKKHLGNFPINCVLMNTPFPHQNLICFVLKISKDYRTKLLALLSCQHQEQNKYPIIPSLWLYTSE